MGLGRQVHRIHGTKNFTLFYIWYIIPVQEKTEYFFSLTEALTPRRSL